MSDVAAAAGIGRREGERRCAALTGLGIVQRDDSGVVLAPDLRALTAPDAVQDLSDVLGTVRVKLAALAGCAAGPGMYATLPDDQHLVIARNAGAPSPLLLRATAAVLDRIEGLRAVWAAGGQHLELGCGAGCQLLSPLLAHPDLTGVGVERTAVVAEEARRRAELLGVADRVEIRVGDAADLAENAAFDTAYWSQPFFPTPSRGPALGAAWRALRPGGMLVAPILVPTPSAEHSPSARAWSIESLMFGAWGIPVPSPAELRGEVHAAGFVDPTVIDVPAWGTRPASVLGVARYVLARKPTTSARSSREPHRLGEVDTNAGPEVFEPDLADALDAYVAARARLSGWIAGIEALTLVHVALVSGVLRRLVEGATVPGAAELTALTTEAVGRIGAALLTHDILRRAGARYRLAPDFEALASPQVRGRLRAILDAPMTRLYTP